MVSFFRSTLERLPLFLSPPSLPLPPPLIPPLPFHSRFILSIYPQAPSSSSLPFSHSHIIFSSFFMVFSFTLDKSTLFSRLLCLELLISAANELKGNCKPRYCFQTWRFNAQLGSRRSWFSGAVSAYLLWAVLVPTWDKKMTFKWLIPTQI